MKRLTVAVVWWQRNHATPRLDIQRAIDLAAENGKLVDEIEINPKLALLVPLEILCDAASVVRMAHNYSTVSVKFLDEGEPVVEMRVV